MTIFMHITRILIIQDLAILKKMYNVNNNIKLNILKKGNNLLPVGTYYPFNTFYQLLLKILLNFTI